MKRIFLVIVIVISFVLICFFNMNHISNNKVEKMNKSDCIQKGADCGVFN